LMAVLAELSLDETTFCSNTSNSHHFCFGCARKNVELELGHGRYPSLSPRSLILRRSNILCLDTSDCKAPFTESEIRRFLDLQSQKALNDFRIRNDLMEVFPFAKQS